MGRETAFQDPFDLFVQWMGHALPEGLGDPVFDTELEAVERVSEQVEALATEQVQVAPSLEIVQMEIAGPADLRQAVEVWDIMNIKPHIM